MVGGTLGGGQPYKTQGLGDLGRALVWLEKLTIRAGRGAWVGLSTFPLFSMTTEGPWHVQSKSALILAVRSQQGPFFLSMAEDPQIKSAFDTYARDGVLDMEGLEAAVSATKHREPTSAQLERYMREKVSPISPPLA
jgi:hypothetical protein